MPNDVFGIASFRSRQQVLHFERALRVSGLTVSIVSTPHDVAVGCGLSVRFRLSDAPAVFRVYQKERPGNLIGFYRVEQAGAARARVQPLKLW